ncbi:MFS transporter [Candidatus Latescibacterota bacterium]
MSLTTRLSLMMFFQYAVWGAWAPIFPEYLLHTVGYSGFMVGVVLSLLPLATIISPFLGGQLADRYFPAERVVGVFHFTGGVLMLVLSRVTDWGLMTGLMLLYSLFYAPTLALTNSIVFMNVRNAGREFGPIRMWGTIGWIAAGLLLSAWRILANELPGLSVEGDMLILAGVLSILMGFVSAAIPHTPPRPDISRPWAFLEAMRMLGERRVASFVIISFFISTQLMFYYILTAPFLTAPSIGIDSSVVAGVMVIGQVSEIVVMAALLSVFIHHFGLKNTMVIGMMSWSLLFLIFALGSPTWLVIGALGLHGFGYVFFFTATFIYVDSIAPRDIRASAQGFISIITLGLGNFIGSLFAGAVQSSFTGGGKTDWTTVFLVPAFITFLSAGVFAVMFHDKRAGRADDEDTGHFVNV